MIFLANVKGHRRLAVARLLPGEERAQAGGVTRVGVRWIALLAYYFFRRFQYPGSRLQCITATM